MKVVAVDSDVVVHIAFAMSWDDVELFECTRASDAFLAGVTVRPEAFVIERRLPDGDGLALVRRLRQDLRTNRTAIIVLTAAYDADDEATALKSGADAYLVKPVEPAVVRQVIRSVLSVPATERRPRRQHCAEMLRAGIAPEPLIDLTDSALAEMDWREQALQHGRDSDARHHSHRWWHHAHVVTP